MVRGTDPTGGEAEEGGDAVARQQEHLQRRQLLERLHRGEQVVSEVELDERRDQLGARRAVEQDLARYEFGIAHNIIIIIK